MRGPNAVPSRDRLADQGVPEVDDLGLPIVFTDKEAPRGCEFESLTLNLRCHRTATYLVLTQAAPGDLRHAWYVCESHKTILKGMYGKEGTLYVRGIAGRPVREYRGSKR